MSKTEVLPHGTVEWISVLINEKYLLNIKAVIKPLNQQILKLISTVEWISVLTNEKYLLNIKAVIKPLNQQILKLILIEICFLQRTSVCKLLMSSTDLRL